MAADSWSEKIEKMHHQLKRSQDELKLAQNDIQEKIKNFDQIPAQQNDYHSELKKMTTQLEAERANQSRLSSDLAKSLELNLKLQFEIEEVKTKASQIINEERKHNQYLTEKNKNLTHELELVQALNSEMRSELVKAKDKFQSEIEDVLKDKEQTRQDFLNLQEEKEKLFQEFQSLTQEKESALDQLQQLESALAQKQEEVQKITESLEQFEQHSGQQGEALKNLSQIAEKKIVELKMALDRKVMESQDYYSHLQQALAQAAILKQENSALKEYISKFSSLQNQQNKIQDQKTEART